MAKAQTTARKATKPRAEVQRTNAPANFRLPPALIEALDDWVAKLNERDALARRWTRTDVVQETLARAVRERGAKGESP